MQTFLPHPNIRRSLKSLDSRRLGKQRVEAHQILNILLNRTKTKGWRNHPAVKMWKGFEGALVDYGIAICNEWIGRGYKDTCKQKIISEGKNYTNKSNPPWMGDKTFHKSHQSNLISKFPEHYKDKFPNTEGGLEYCWPV